MDDAAPPRPADTTLEEALAHRPDLQKWVQASPIRIVQRDGRRRRVAVRNGPRDGWRDIYHYLLTWPWWAFVVLMASIYFGVNLTFALLYLADLRGLSNASGASPFWTAFNFSVETLGTIGYGAIFPRDAYTNTLVLVEAFVSIFLTAVLTGLIFARVSRPTARVIFSRVALITHFDGQRVLMFRAANQRANQMLEAEVTLNLATRGITAEGVPLRRFHALEPVRARSPLFALSWTVMHAIDERSPLAGLGVESLKDAAAEVVVTLSGVDEVTSQRVHARHSYIGSEILFDQHFENVVFPLDDGSGRWVIDYAKFHDVRPA